MAQTIEPSWDMGCGHFDSFGDPTHDCSSWKDETMTNEVNYNDTVDENHIYQLRKFRRENSFNIGHQPEVVKGAPATDEEICELLLFALPFAKRELTLPRNLEAMRVIKLIPEDIGAALFEKTGM